MGLRVSLAARRTTAFQRQRDVFLSIAVVASAQWLRPAFERMEAVVRGRFEAFDKLKRAGRRFRDHGDDPPNALYGPADYPASPRPTAPSTSWKRLFPKPEACQGAKPACGGAQRARP